MVLTNVATQVFLQVEIQVIQKVRLALEVRLTLLKVGLSEQGCTYHIILSGKLAFINALKFRVCGGVGVVSIGTNKALVLGGGIEYFANSRLGYAFRLVVQNVIQHTL